jgi:hypothetical protein
MFTCCSSSLLPQTTASRRLAGRATLGIVLFPALRAARFLLFNSSKNWWVRWQAGSSSVTGGELRRGTWRPDRARPPVVGKAGACGLQSCAGATPDRASMHTYKKLAARLSACLCCCLLSVLLLSSSAPSPPSKTVHVDSGRLGQASLRHHCVSQTRWTVD